MLNTWNPLDRYSMFKSRSYNLLPSTNWKYIVSPSIAPLTSKVKSSFGKTGIMNWLPDKSCISVVPPTIKLSEVNATIYAFGLVMGKEKYASELKSNDILIPNPPIKGCGKSHDKLKSEPEQFNSAELAITGSWPLAVNEFGPAKLKSRSYSELPSTNWKVNASPADAPSTSGVDVSSPQTESDCWPPIKISDATDALPTTNPSGEKATM